MKFERDSFLHERQGKGKRRRGRKRTSAKQEQLTEPSRSALTWLVGSEAVLLAFCALIGWTHDSVFFIGSSWSIGFVYVIDCFYAIINCSVKWLTCYLYIKLCIILHCIYIYVNCVALHFISTSPRCALCVLLYIMCSSVLFSGCWCVLWTHFK